MKRISWWALLGVSGTGLAALLLGQSVLGQPEGRQPPPPLPSPTISLPQLENAAAKGVGAKPALEATSGQALQFPPPPAGAFFPDSLPAPANPMPPTGTKAFPPVSVQSPPPLLPSPKADKQMSGTNLAEVQPGRQQPALSIEWAAPMSIRINQPMSCQILVRNASTTPAQNVVVRHRLGQGVTCKTSDPPAVHDSGELVWNLGPLAAEQTRRIDLTLVSQARGPLNCHASVTFTAVAAHQVQVREPQLAVKMSAPETVIAGENVTLIFAVSNPGDGVTESIKLKTILPDGLEHPRGKVMEFDVGNLAPKEIRKVQLVCPSTSGGTHKCTVVVTGEGGLVAQDTAQFEILIPKLDVAMSGPKLRYLDRHAIYVLKVTNPGSAPASNVEVQELIPAGLKFHQANHGGTYQEASRRVSWSLGELQPGQSKDIAVELIPIESGEQRLIAQAQAARGLKSEAEARTLVEGLPALFLEVGHVDDPLEVGAETTYEIRLANTGTKMETNVEVTCTLPEQLEFRGAKCSTTLRYRQEGRELVFETLPRLAARADVIYRVQVRGVAPGDIRFRTRIKADGLKEPMVREESMRIYSDGAPPRTAPAPAAPIVPGLTPTSTPTPLPTLSNIAPAPAPNPLPLSAPSAPSIPPPSGLAPLPRPVLPGMPSTRLAPVPLPLLSGNS